jgi:hypothetical protein
MELRRINQQFRVLSLWKENEVTSAGSLSSSSSSSSPGYFYLFLFSFSDAM